MVLVSAKALSTLCFLCLKRVKPEKMTYKLKNVRSSSVCRSFWLMPACWILAFRNSAYLKTWYQCTKLFSAGYIYCYRYVSFKTCFKPSCVVKLSIKSLLELSGWGHKNSKNPTPKLKISEPPSKCSKARKTTIKYVIIKTFLTNQRLFG